MKAFLQSSADPRMQSPEQDRNNYLRVGLHEPGSAPERWALVVLRATECEWDPRTLNRWATFVGISYGALRELCHVVKVSPHDARDFARLLRAVVQSRRTGCEPSAYLDVADTRTLKKLLRRGGDQDGRWASVDVFLNAQRLIDPNSAGLHALSNMLHLQEP